MKNEEINSIKAFGKNILVVTEKDCLLSHLNLSETKFPFQKNFLRLIQLYDFESYRKHSFIPFKVIEKDNKPGLLTVNFPDGLFSKGLVISLSKSSDIFYHLDDSVYVEVYYKYA